MVAKIDIVNAALARIGENIHDGDDEPGAAENLMIFDSTLSYLLTRSDWHFATTTRQLGQMVGAPAQHWKYRYQLPSDMVGAPRAVHTSGAEGSLTQNFYLTGDELWTDEPAIWMRFLFLPDLRFLPGYFRELLERALMAEFALTIREDAPMRQRLREEVFGPPSHGGDGGLIGEAMNLDAQAKPSQRVSEGYSPLVDVRYT
jgi:hypothetical protein